MERKKFAKTSGRLENVECGEEMWKTSQVGCRIVEHGEETWKTSQVDCRTVEHGEEIGKTSQVDLNLGAIQV